MIDAGPARGSGSMRRIGIMGGTFDPLHHGHLVCGEEARYQFQLEEVIFVPAGKPWQKKNMSPGPLRHQMTVLGTADNPAFSVSGVEIERPGPTYTTDTLDWFRQEHGGSTDLYFITGADAVARILSWRRPDEVLNKAHFIAARRPGVDLKFLDEAHFRGKVSLMEIPTLSISSTDIRRRVSEGRPIRYLVPGPVGQFIQDHNLYRDAG